MRIDLENDDILFSYNDKASTFNIAYNKDEELVVYTVNGWFAKRLNEFFGDGKSEDLDDFLQGRHFKEHKELGVIFKRLLLTLSEEIVFKISQSDALQRLKKMLKPFSEKEYSSFGLKEFTGQLKKEKSLIAGAHIYCDTSRVETQQYSVHYQTGTDSVGVSYSGSSHPFEGNVQHYRTVDDRACSI